MRGEASAYTVLGLEPGADPTAVERAYKELIKRYHPDRQGGDERRAAEIIRAYRELRGRPEPTDIDFHEEEPSADEPSGNGWIVAAMVLVAGVALLLIATGPAPWMVRQLAPGPVPPMLGRVAASTGASDSLDQPLDRAEVDGGVRDAVRITRSRDDNALLSSSRNCHRALRSQPSVSQLDRCVAFDDAVVQLQDRDPLWDGGPFSQLAVTRRQWSAASSLSNDYLAVDGRLDRIRLQVELALAPPDPRAVKPAEDSDSLSSD
jgi:hypothetical protein